MALDRPGREPSDSTSDISQRAPRDKESMDSSSPEDLLKEEPRSESELASGEGLVRLLQNLVEGRYVPVIPCHELSSTNQELLLQRLFGDARENCKEWVVASSYGDQPSGEPSDIAHDDRIFSEETLSRDHKQKLVDVKDGIETENFWQWCGNSMASAIGSMSNKPVGSRALMAHMTVLSRDVVKDDMAILAKTELGVALVDPRHDKFMAMPEKDVKISRVDLLHYQQGDGNPVFGNQPRTTSGEKTVEVSRPQPTTDDFKLIEFAKTNSGMTWKAFCQKTGLSKQSIAKIKNGEPVGWRAKSSVDALRTWFVNRQNDIYDNEE